MNLQSREALTCKLRCPVRQDSEVPGMEADPVVGKGPSPLARDPNLMANLKCKELVCLGT